jgi:hypothetical protein
MYIISDEHSRDILAAIPSRMMEGDRARLERMVLIKLDEILGTYHDVLSTRRDFAKERKRWLRIDKRTEQLAQEMRKLRRETHHGVIPTRCFPTAFWPCSGRSTCGRRLAWKGSTLGRFAAPKTHIGNPYTPGCCVCGRRI